MARFITPYLLSPAALDPHAARPVDHRLAQPLKTGVYRARYAELDDAGVERPEGDGMIPLPTVTVEEEGDPRLYRLPDKLNGWAYDNVALALSGTRLFPCDVEFGVLRGRPYAEFVVAPPEELN